MKTTRSELLFGQAQQVLPGGVDSAVRAFRAVGGMPRFIDHASGAYLYDVDGNRFIDYVLSWGPLLLGNRPPGGPPGDCRGGGAWHQLRRANRARD